MKKLIFGLILIGLFSCKENKVAEFSFTGKTNGLENGTILILENIDTDKVLDSTIVQNNSFVFNTKLTSSPIRAVFHTKDYSNYRFVWLENNEMIFDATLSDFRNALIKGSKTEDLSQSLKRAIDTVSRNERTKLEKKFVRDNPNSIVSANLLSICSTTWGKEKTKELFDKFSVENKNTEYGKKITRYIELNMSPKIGEDFVDFRMADQMGNTNKLSDFKGKVILLEFWAAWCGPCREENPNLVKTYQTYKKKGFEVFAVSIDKDKESWLEAIKKDNLTWKHVSELNGQDNTAGLIYGVSGIPDNFLIDQNGKIIGRNLRGDKLNEKLAEIMPATNKTYTQ